MKIVIAASTAFHLRHLAVELDRLGVEVEFHSYLPRWKTRRYGLADRITVSHFLPLLPWSALALLRGFEPWLRWVREGLFAKVDRRIAVTMGAADVFVGLSAIAVESAAKARDGGALVLIERGSTHIAMQRRTAVAGGFAPPSPVYFARELASYEAADKIIVLSRFALNSFLAEDVSIERLETTMLGVDTDQFTPDDHVSAGPVKAIFVGGWSSRKGADWFGPLLEAVPSMTLTHAGTQVDLPFPVHPRFTTLGHLPTARLAEALRQHDLLLFPSRDDGFGMVLAEALASGLRVVASDACAAPDLAEIVGEEFVTVVPSDDFAGFVVAIEQQIAAIRNAPSSRSVPGVQIESLSWQGYGQRYHAMLQRLLGQPR